MSYIYDRTGNIDYSPTQHRQNVRQVVVNSVANAITSTSTSNVDIGQSANITLKKSGNYVWVLWNAVSFIYSTDAIQMQVDLWRSDLSSPLTSTLVGNGVNASIVQYQGINLSYLDTTCPASATYYVTFKRTAGAGSYNCGIGYNASGEPRNLTLMEIDKP